MGVDTKIEVLAILEPEIRDILFWHGGHLEIQNGGHQVQDPRWVLLLYKSPYENVSVY